MPTPGGSKGCSWPCACARGCPPTALPLDELDGLVTVEGDQAVLTRRGRLLANEVALRLA